MSSFDSWLEEEGILEKVTNKALEKVKQYKEKQLSKNQEEKIIYTTKEVRETMDKFGFVYADVNFERANSKVNEYINMGFNANIIPKKKSFEVVINFKKE